MKDKCPTKAYTCTTDGRGMPASQVFSWCQTDATPNSGTLSTAGLLPLAVADLKEKGEMYISLSLSNSEKAAVLIVQRSEMQ